MMMVQHALSALVVCLCLCVSRCLCRADVQVVSYSQSQCSALDVDFFDQQQLVDLDASSSLTINEPPLLSSSPLARCESEWEKQNHSKVLNSNKKDVHTDDDPSFASRFLQTTLLPAFRETVHRIVQHQTATWIYTPRYMPVNESALGLCQVDTYKTETGDKQQRQQSKQVQVQVQVIQDDDDLDGNIDGYFRALVDACSIRASAPTTLRLAPKNKTTATTTNSNSDDLLDDVAARDQQAATLFETECLGLMHSLVYEPRCITRCDSRTPCNGKDDASRSVTGTTRTASTISDPTTTTTTRPLQDVILEHFQQDTLNLVLVGAGPVGLILANALVNLQAHERSLQQEDDDNDGDDDDDDDDNGNEMSSPEVRNIEDDDDDDDDDDGDDDNEVSFPEVRILMLEARASSDGWKQPYTRNWEVNLDFHVFEGMVDPRILEVYKTLTPKERPGFPTSTNLLETLFLLSNRDHGVKFLYGVRHDDPQIMEVLDRTPNLLMVDTTGHRLEPLQRGDHCHTGSYEATETRANVVISKPFRPQQLTGHSEIHLNKFNVQSGDFDHVFDTLEQNGHELTVAHDLGRNIMYPIDPDTSLPFSSVWLEIHGLPLSRDKMMRLQADATFLDDLEEEDGDDNNNLWKHLYADGGPFCAYCKQLMADFEAKVEAGVKDEDDSPEEWELCEDMLYTEYISDSSPLLRKDIRMALQEGRFSGEHFVQRWVNETFRGSGTKSKNNTSDMGKESSNAWYPTSGATFNISPTLFGTLVRPVLQAAGYFPHPIGQSLSMFYPALEKRVQDLQAAFPPLILSSHDERIVEALRRMNSVAGGDGFPTVTVFHHKPYIYTDGVKPTTYGKSNTTVLRFGDSFTTGDSLKGSGLYSHVVMIREFVRSISQKVQEERS